MKEIIINEIQKQINIKNRVKEQEQQKDNNEFNKGYRKALLKATNTNIEMLEYLFTQASKTTFLEELNKEKIYYLDIKNELMSKDKIIIGQYNFGFHSARLEENDLRLKLIEFLLKMYEIIESNKFNTNHNQETTNTTINKPQHLLK